MQVVIGKGNHGVFRCRWLSAAGLPRHGHRQGGEGTGVLTAAQLHQNIACTTAHRSCTQVMHTGDVHR